MFLDPPTPPIWLETQKCAILSTFSESHLKYTPKVGVHRENLLIGNVAQTVFGGFYICWDYVISFSQHFPMRKFSPSPPTSPSPLSHWNSENWLKFGKIFLKKYFEKYDIFGWNIYQSICTKDNIHDFLNKFLIFFHFFADFSKKKSRFLKKYDQNSTASTANFCYMISFFGNFPSTLNTLSLMENCEKCAFLLQVACGSGAISIFQNLQVAISMYNFYDHVEGLVGCF